MILQVSFPGQPDPSNLGTFLKRLLFLLSDAQAAAAVLGVDVHHPGLVLANANRGTNLQEEGAIVRAAEEAVLEAAKEPETLSAKGANVVLLAKDPDSSGSPKVERLYPRAASHTRGRTVTQQEADTEGR